MTDKAMKARVTALLEGFGFEAKEIPTGEKKTPDLLVRSASDSYLIELKELLGDEKDLLEVQEVLARGEIAELAEPWAPKNTISGVAKKAQRQVAASEEKAAFHILWLDCSGHDPESQQKQAFATLYGTTNVYDIQDSSFFRECYYFHDSVFFRWREQLDGAVVMVENGGALYLNTHSPQIRALRESALVKAFGDGVVDPEELEKAGASLIADCAIDRKDSDAVKQYLATKYNRRFLDHMNVGRLTAIMPVEAPGATTNKK